MNLKIKLTGIVAAFALVFSGVTSVSGATTAELIDLLVSMGIISADQVAVVSAAVGGTTTTSSSYAALRTAPDMTIGARGANVTLLQQMLIAGGYSIPAGATGYFGGQTQAALAQYQAAKGITPAVGYFGPITKASVVAAVTTPVDPTTPTTPTTPSTGLQGGEAEVNSVTVRSEDDASADSRDQKVASFEIDLDRNSGDIQLDRVDLTFDATVTPGEDRLFRIFNAVSIADSNGNVLGSRRTTSRNDWNDYNTNVGTVRISGLNGVARGDARTEFFVLVDTARLSQADLDIVLDVTVDSIRYTEATGVVLTEVVDEDASFRFRIEDEDSADLRLRTASNNPLTRTIRGSETSNTDGEEVLVFTVESRKTDFMIETIDAEITVTNPGTGADVNHVVRRANLYRGSTRLDSRNVPANGLLTFDLREYEIRANRTEEFTVTVDLQKIDGVVVEDGATVQVTVDNVQGYDENDNDEDSGTATAVGRTHSFSTIVANVTGVKTSVTQAPNQSASGTIAFEFSVEAIDGDVEVLSADLNTDATQTSSAGTALAKPAGVLSRISAASTANAIGGGFEVPQGEKATFILEFTYTTAAAGNNGTYRITLDKVTGESVETTSPALSLVHGA